MSILGIVIIMVIWVLGPLGRDPEPQDFARFETRERKHIGNLVGPGECIGTFEREPASFLSVGDVRYLDPTSMSNKAQNL